MGGRSNLSHYDDVLEELRQKGQKLANQYIVELYIILTDEEKLSPEDCRAKIEHDCLDLWSKATIRKYLPSESKDSKKQLAGKIAAENKKKEKRKAILQLTQSENGGARINLTENDFFSQNEEESRTFHDQLDQQLSTRTISPELVEASKIIADRDTQIQELKKDKEDLLKQYSTSNSGTLFLSRDLAIEICRAVSSSGPITEGLNVEHNGHEITAVHQVSKSVI
jgi:hypothetical protein